MKQEIVTTDRDPAQHAGELLYGVRSIAAYLGTTRRQAQFLVEKGVLPVWREGKTIIARRETVRNWIVEREASGMRAERENQEDLAA